MRERKKRKEEKRGEREGKESNRGTLACYLYKTGYDPFFY